MNVKSEPVEPSEANELTVDLGERSYDIVVDGGLIATAGERIAPLLKSPRVVVVTDDNVEPHWLSLLMDSLARDGIEARSVVLAAGEHTKSFRHFEDLVENILAGNIDRKTSLIALGGGVIGDITGFAAAVALRGIDFVQIPTTLLSQVDSSVGGKTGINSVHGKNLVGAFHQPRLVLADLDALETLPRRQLVNGYAEVVKYGLIDDHGFFEWCEENGRALIDGDQTARRHAVTESCRAKARIVARDERESGLRALLNLGHTFGHALEAETGYGDRLLHGEAVAIGMLLAFRLSQKLGHCDGQDVGRVRSHLEAIGLPAGLDGVADASWTAERLFAHMTKDKKAEAGSVTFILAQGIGRAFISRDVEPDDVKAVLEDALSS